jgi:hypothetical protein
MNFSLWFAFITLLRTFVVLADVCGKPSLESWEGECSKPAMGGWGTPKGKGRYVLPDGSKHEGEFENGRPVGWGVFTFTNGRRYEGPWLNGEPHGPGIFSWKDGKRFPFT